MVLEKKVKRTPIQRLRVIILGKEKPNFATRISVSIGFGIWVYLASWQVLTFMTLSLMGSLEQAEVLKNAFSRLGSKLYGFTNTLEILTLHNLIQLAAYLVVLVGLILIYRRKRLGFLIYIIGNVAIIAATILILGLKYFQYEMTYTYVILIGVSTLYFTIGALWFYRWKPRKEKAKQEANPPSTD